MLTARSYPIYDRDMAATNKAKAIRELKRRLGLLPMHLAHVVDVALRSGAVSDIWEEAGTVFLATDPAFLMIPLSDFEAQHDDDGNPFVLMLDRGQLWRAPDEYFRGEAIWYGHGGRRSDAATYVADLGDRTFKVIEYRRASSFLDDPKSAQGSWLLLETWGVQGWSVRGAAFLGAEQIANRGGDESWDDHGPPRLI